MQCASRSPVTPLPATLTSSRHRPSPPCGRSRGDGPVLQELGAVVEDPAQPAFVDQLLGQRDRRHAAVVVPDHVRHAGPLHRLDHGLGFARRCGPAASRTSPSCPPAPRRWRFRRACRWGWRYRSGRSPGDSTSSRQSVSDGFVAPVRGERLGAVRDSARRPPSAPAGREDRRSWFTCEKALEWVRPMKP